MGLTTRQKAEQLATFRHVQVFLMETLARWTPQTPEMEVKVLFGRHIWDLAQHADALGKRTYELRAPMHFTLVPSAEYSAVLKRFAGLSETKDKLQGFYEVMLPQLAAKLKAYIAATDTLQDEPSVRVLEGMLRDFDRMRREHESLLAELPNLKQQRPEHIQQLADSEASCLNIVAEQPAVIAVGVAE
jgi:DNA-binding ferritin-like protein